jgi:glutamine amidotransferase
MCRWLAYYGAPVLIHDALYTPHHSLIDQSYDSKLGAETTNGDGVGIGWYSRRRPCSAASSPRGTTRT